MTNDLVTNEFDFSVKFEPSVIQINNKDTLENAVKGYASKYKSLIVTEENIADVKKVKAEMNKVVKAIDDRRKEVKGEFSKPLTDFENWINQLKSDITTVIEPIDSGIKEMEERERLERKAVIETTIAEMAPNYHVEISEIDLISSWWNKSNFSASNKPNKKTLEEISNAMKLIFDAKEKRKNDYSIIESYAKAKEIEPEGFLTRIEMGATAPEVMKEIDHAVVSKAERKERERKKAEYEAAVASISQPETIEADGKSVDVETGEILDKPVNGRELLNHTDLSDVKTVVLRITGTTEQFRGFNRYLVDNGIKVEEVK